MFFGLSLASPAAPNARGGVPFGVVEGRLVAMHVSPRIEQILCKLSPNMDDFCKGREVTKTLTLRHKPSIDDAQTLVRNDVDLAERTTKNVTTPD